MILTDNERAEAEAFKANHKTYSVDQAAVILRVSRRTVMTYIKSGRLTGTKIGGKWRFTEATLKRLLTGDQE